MTVVGVDPTYEPSCDAIPVGPRSRWAKLEVSVFPFTCLSTACFYSSLNLAALHGVLDGVAWAWLMTGFGLPFSLVLLSK